jgi:hypothetical protein
MSHHHCHGHHHESCGAHHHEHSGSGHEGGSCCGHQLCQNCGHCGCSCHQHEHQDFSHQLLEMADEAWMDLLQEKIKKQIEASSGARLDQLAKLVADSNKERWKNKMGTQNATEEFKDKVSDYFSHHEG